MTDGQERDETRRRLRLGGHDVGMYIATCARQARSLPLSSVQELLRAIVGLDETDLQIVALRQRKLLIDHEIERVLL
jgi:hypothetical protein